MSKTEEIKTNMRLVRWAIGLVAILVPLLPIVVWLQSVLPVYRSMWHGPMLILYMPARALGLVGFVMMIYQFVLSSKFAIIEKAFTRAGVYRRHRTLGMIGFLIILLHGTAMLAFDLIMAGEIVLGTPKTIGLIAMILLIIAVFVAIFWKPLKLSNKQWMRIHRLTYVVLPLAFYHAIVMGTTINTSRWVMGLFWVLGAIYVIVVIRRIRQEILKVRKKRRSRTA